MVTSYILILTISAALIAFGLRWLSTRIWRTLKRPAPLPTGIITLGVTAAMLIVVAAPIWLFALLALAAVALTQAPRLAPEAPLVLLLLTIPLITAPLLGATAGFAIDAALIAASMLGETYAA